jgi:hypothetical protein
MTTIAPHTYIFNLSKFLKFKEMYLNNDYNKIQRINEFHNLSKT